MSVSEQANRGERAGRALSVRVSPLLWLVGLCMFLPLVKACGQTETVTSLAATSPGLAWVFAPYFAAIPLALATSWALRRGAPGRALGLVALVVTVATFASAGFILYLESHEHTLDAIDRVRLAFETLAAFGASMLIIRALRIGGWRRHALVLTAYGLAALPLALLWAHLGGGDLRFGAWLSVALFVAIPALTLPRLHAITRR